MLIIHVAGEAVVCSFSLQGIFRHRIPHDLCIHALHLGTTGVVESELPLEPDRLRSQLLSLVSSDPERATSPEAWVPHLQNGVMCLCVRTGADGGEALANSACSVSVSDKYKGMCLLLWVHRGRSASFGRSSQGGFARRQGGLHCSERVWGGHRVSNDTEHVGGTTVRSHRGTAVASSPPKGSLAAKESRCQ